MRSWDYTSTAVYGPLTRTVADAALFLDLVAGPSPCDPASLPAPGLSYREVFDRFDLLVTPTVPYDPPPARGPFPTHTEGREQVPAGVAAFTIPFNMSGHPAATVRAGFSDAGLPVGLHIVGPRHRDDLVLRAARVFERARPWHPNWPEIQERFTGSPRP